MGIAIRRPASGTEELPMVLTATAAVTVLPAILATWLVPSRHAPALIISTVVAMALAAIVTRLGAAAWSRKPRAQDMLFADLMLWSWLRTRWHEHRLIAAQRRLAELDAKTTGMPLGALTRMSRLLESRDMYTYGHSRRVARHAETIARAMHLDPHEVEQVRRAALVHDIGKIYTPREILDKPERLTDAEFDIIKRHADDGADLLAHLGEPEVVAIVRHHHERLDGGGYPNGLSGAAIPLGARIIAVADTFDALTSTRSYRRSVSHKKALQILSAEAGTQLDADAVSAFARHYRAGRPAALVAAATSGGERLLGSLGGATAGLGSRVGAAGAAAAVLALGPALEPLSSRAVPVRAAPQAAAALPALPATSSRETAKRTRTASVPGGRRSPAKARDRAPARRPSPAPTSSSPTAAAPPATTHTTPSTSTSTSTSTGTPAADTTPARPSTAGTPEVATPATTVPSIPLPAAPTVTPPTEVKVPAVTTPAVTAPAITTPVASTPAVTVPAVTIDLPAIRVPLPQR
jgi:putative nucleotidyltransferase with HDIG domain